MFSEKNIGVDFTPLSCTYIHKALYKLQVELKSLLMCDSLK